MYHGERKRRDAEEKADRAARECRAADQDSTAPDEDEVQCGRQDPDCAGRYTGGSSGRGIVPPGRDQRQRVLCVAEGVHGSGEGSSEGRSDARCDERRSGTAEEGKRAVTRSGGGSDGRSAGAQKKSLLTRKAKRYQRHSSEQKEDLLRMVETSPLSRRRTLKQLKLPKSTYYRWQQRGTLEDHPLVARRVWNRLLEDEVATILALAQCYTALSPRELAFKITDDGQFSVSESTVYRILKRAGLLREYPQVIPAAKEYHRKTTRVNEMWQTDLMEVLLPGWGKHPVGNVVDDFSRFSIALRRLRDATGETVQELIEDAIAETGMLNVPRPERVKLLSDNGACYIWGPLNEYLNAIGIKHIFSMRNHPQTNGKVERLNRTAKEKLMLVVYASPEAFDQALEEFRHWYNYEHYHEGISNLHPADVYYGRAEAILKQRKQLQTKTKKARKKANLKPPKTHERNVTYEPKPSKNLTKKLSH